MATIQAFKDRLPELDWLDDATRSAAEEKANAITYKVSLSPGLSPALLTPPADRISHDT